MAKFGYCPRGGQDGIATSQRELAKFAEQNGRRYIDEVIPLPNGNTDDCGEENHGDEIYYECLDSGSHGWCCPKYGKVTQWG